MGTSANLAILCDWNLHSKKFKRVTALVMGLAIAVLCVIPMLLSPITLPIVMEMGLGVYAMMWIGVFVGITIIHEGLHGLFFYWYSRKVSFGVKWSRLGPTPYATARGQVFTKKQYRMIAVAPQALSVAFIIVAIPFGIPMLAFGLIAAIGNLGGGCIDLYTAWFLHYFPDDVMVEDTSDGFRVWGHVT